MTLELLFVIFRMSENLVWLVRDYEDSNILYEGSRIPIHLLGKNVAYATVTPQEGGKYTEITCFIEA